MGAYSGFDDEDHSNDQSNNQSNNPAEEQDNQQSINQSINQIESIDQDVQSRLSIYQTACSDMLTEIKSRLLRSLKLHSNQSNNQLEALIDNDPYVNAANQSDNQSINQTINQSLRSDWIAACDAETTEATIDRYLRLHQSISFLRHILRMITALSNNQSNNQSNDDIMIKQIEEAMEAMGLQAQ